jgi:hypothetical protein
MTLKLGLARMTGLVVDACCIHYAALTNWLAQAK